MLLGYFHMRSRATDTITAIDNAGEVDKLLDTFICNHVAFKAVSSEADLVLMSRTGDHSA
jgi:hypothetical protein